MGEYASTQTLVIHQWAGPSVVAHPIQPPPVCVALLSRKKADCDVAAVPRAVQSADRCSVCHFAQARPTMPCISLVSVVCTDIRYGSGLGEV